MLLIEDSIVLSRPFAFPNLGTTELSLDTWQLCRRANNCSQCVPDAPECVAVHRDCLDFFRRQPLCDGPEGLHRLWTWGAWGKPWAKSMPILLDHSFDRASLEVISTQLELRWLLTTPLEVIELIRQFSPQSVLWRLVSVIQLVARGSGPPSTEHTTVSMGSVGDWERGQPFLAISASSRSKLPFIRITMDYRGIAKVTRLSSQPPFSPSRSDALAFIVGDEVFFVDIMAHFKVRSPQHWTLPKKAHL